MFLSWNLVGRGRREDRKPRIRPLIRHYLWARYVRHDTARARPGIRRRRKGRSRRRGEDVLWDLTSRHRGYLLLGGLLLSFWASDEEYAIQSTSEYHRCSIAEAMRLEQTDLWQFFPRIHTLHDHRVTGRACAGCYRWLRSCIVTAKRLIALHCESPASYTWWPICQPYSVNAPESRSSSAGVSALPPGILPLSIHSPSRLMFLCRIATSGSLQPLTIQSCFSENARILRRWPTIHCSQLSPICLTPSCITAVCRS